MSDKASAGYINLVRGFLNKEMDAGTFERSYLNMFKNEKEFLPTNVFEILDSLFADVDAFCSNPEFCRDEDLNEELLRDSCAEALKKLLN